MIYQVTATIFFTKLSDAEDLAKYIASKFDDAVVVHPDEPNQEGCSVELIKCFHDETPTKPCVSCGTIACPPNI